MEKIELFVNKKGTTISVVLVWEDALPSNNARAKAAKP
jgi:hypothetical protein